MEVLKFEGARGKLNSGGGFQGNGVGVFPVKKKKTTKRRMKYRVGENPCEYGRNNEWNKRSQKKLP